LNITYYWTEAKKSLETNFTPSPFTPRANTFQHCTRYLTGFVFHITNSSGPAKFVLHNRVAILALRCEKFLLRN